MKILSIESSCDETAAAVVEDGRQIISNVVFSQSDIHKKFGGVVPELASRKHIEKISIVTEEALQKACCKISDIDSIAVTYAPGLIGALLVGVNFAKGLAYAAGKPLIPVHHIKGHIAANYLASPNLKPPFIALVVSGGHTLIVNVKSYTDIETISRTRDDAAGEAFDKIARVLGLPYPGGANLDALAKGGNPSSIKLPKIEINGSPLDFSFSGLKTHIINLVHTSEQKGLELPFKDVAAAFIDNVVEMIISRVERVYASIDFALPLVLAGGVAANSVLRQRCEMFSKKQGIAIYMPPLYLCGDNAAMIAAQGYFEYLDGNLADKELNGIATMPL